jgi:hypothetical protein
LLAAEAALPDVAVQVLAEPQRRAEPAWQREARAVPLVERGLSQRGEQRSAA